MVTLGKFAAENVDSCPVCGGDGEFKIDAPTQYDFTLSVYYCPNCESSYNNPRMTKEAMDEFYAGGEYMANTLVKRNGRGSFGERRRALRNMIILTQFVTNINETKRALDVGCSQGHFLERIKDWAFGVETVGYDIYADPEAVCEVISDKSEITGEFDLISCVHVLEHMHDPLAELEWMNSLLVEDGILLLEVPIASYVIIEHPVMFSVKSMAILMERVGLEHYTTLDVPALESCILIARK